MLIQADERMNDQSASEVSKSPAAPTDEASGGDDDVEIPNTPEIVVTCQPVSLAPLEKRAGAIFEFCHEYGRPPSAPGAARDAADDVRRDGGSLDSDGLCEDIFACY